MVGCLVVWLLGCLVVVAVALQLVAFTLLSFSTVFAIGWNYITKFLSNLNINNIGSKSDASGL